MPDKHLCEDGTGTLTPPALPTPTCGVAGTSDCSHLSSWSLLPDHGTKAVLITDLMGFCRGVRDSAGERGRAWQGGLRAGSRLREAKAPPGHLPSFPSKVKPRAPPAPHSPGHRWALHCRYSSCGPWHAAPPKKGPEQTRSRRCVPPPHVALQAPHDTQACHFPSTVRHGQVQRHRDEDEEGEVRSHRDAETQGSRDVEQEARRRK